MLFKQLLWDIGYDDMAVVNLLMLGARICGPAAPSGIWRREQGPEQTISIEDLWRSAPEAQRQFLEPSSAPACADNEERDFANEVWQVTLEEVRDGSLLGPFTARQITAKHGARWVGAKRFGIVRDGKLCPIDDFSQYGHTLRWRIYIV